MSAPNKFAVLLKPSDVQPALDRAAQYSRMVPEIEVVAIRVINDFKESEKEQIALRENSAFEQLKRKYSSIQNFTLKIVFSKDVAKGFIDAAQEEECSLEVISANKRHTLRDMFVSSIDSSIMRKSRLPLLVVKQATQTATLGQNVILAIDFTEVAHISKLDEVLYKAASKFASAFDGVVHVANCITPENSGLMGGNLEQSKIISSVGAVSLDKIQHQLAEEFARKHNISKENMHLLNGRMDEEIPRLSELLNARMVCMGSTPRSTFFGSLNSSASELVLEQIKGDIFIVNADTLK